MLPGGSISLEPQPERRKARSRMASSPWKNDSMYVYVFNVGRGLSIFVRTPNGFGMIYDLGGSDDFSPLEFVKKNFHPYLTYYTSKTKTRSKIAQLFISHPHNDHITEVAGVGEKEGHPFYASLLTCPHDKCEEEKFDFQIMGDANDTDALKAYRKLFKDRKPPLQTLRPDCIDEGVNFEYGVYYMRPAEIKKHISEDAQEYINGSSVCAYFRYGKHSILLPGDVTPEVMKRLLKGTPSTEKRYFSGPEVQGNKWEEETSDQPSLGDCLKKHGLSVLVAPHHGLESSYSPELYEKIKGGKPQFVLISEKRKTEDGNEGIVDSRYQSEDGAEGVTVKVNGVDEDYFSLGTANGYHFAVVFDAGAEQGRYYAVSDPDDLLDIK